MKIKTFSERTSGSSPRDPGGVSPPAPPTAAGEAQDRTAAELLKLAERISSAREQRVTFLPKELFAEPAWDMLIALFRADVAGFRLTVTNLCDEGRVPATTALRWIDHLIDIGLARRVENHLDRRVIFIELEPSGRTTVRNCLSQIWTVFYG